MSKDKKTILILSVILIVVVVLTVIFAAPKSANAPEEQAPEANSGSAALDGGNLIGSVASASTGSASGVWRSKFASGYILELSPDGIVREFQNQRLMNSGNWTVSGDQITLNIGKSTYSYKIRAGASVLILTTVNNTVLEFERVQL